MVLVSDPSIVLNDFKPCFHRCFEEDIPGIVIFVDIDHTNPQPLNLVRPNLSCCSRNQFLLFFLDVLLLIKSHNLLLPLLPAVLHHCGPILITEVEPAHVGIHGPNSCALGLLAGR